MYARVFDRAKIEAMIPTLQPVNTAKLEKLEFLKRFARDINEFGDSTFSNADKQTFFKELKQFEEKRG